MNAARRVWLCGALVVVFLHLVAPLHAQPLADERAAYERFFTATNLEAAWFAPFVLEEVPLARLTRIRDELLRQHGGFRDAAREGDRWSVLLERARVPSRLALDSAGRIRSIFFEPAIEISGGLSAALAAFDGLPDRRSLLILDQGRERAAREPDQPLGVGSAFKMLVLRELIAATRAGRLSLDQVVHLKPEWRAAGSGMIRNWADGTAVTLGTLATMMIAISDNTATDALMDMIGREHLDRVAPSRNRPLITTRELHLLRVSQDKTLAERWARGDVVARRAILRELPRGHRLPQVWGDALWREMDYLFTARELCALIAEIGTRPEMRVNAGPAASLGWDWVAYKGGSTDTSINMTVLAGKAARSVCVAATWNAPRAVSREKFNAVVRRILAVLAEE
jgi:hypothetical protein